MKLVCPPYTSGQPLGARLGGPPAPDSPPLTHVTVTVHAQRLDLGGLLLLVLGAEGPEQGPSDWRSGRGGRGPNCSPRPRGPGLHSPAGGHHPTRCSGSISGFRRPRDLTSSSCCLKFSPLLKEATDPAPTKSVCDFRFLDHADCTSVTRLEYRNSQSSQCLAP